MIYTMKLIISGSHLFPCLLTTLATNIIRLSILMKIIVFILSYLIQRIWERYKAQRKRNKEKRQFEMHKVQEQVWQDLQDTTSTKNKQEKSGTVKDIIQERIKGRKKWLDMTCSWIHPKVLSFIYLFRNPAERYFDVFEAFHVWVDKIVFDICTNKLGTRGWNEAVDFWLYSHGLRPWF